MRPSQTTLSEAAALGRDRGGRAGVLNIRASGMNDGERDDVPGERDSSGRSVVLAE